MRMPPAGSRPVITSQKDWPLLTPTPSGAGHVMSAGTLMGAAGSGGGTLRAGLRVCAIGEATISDTSATAKRRHLPPPDSGAKRRHAIHMRSVLADADQAARRGVADAGNGAPQLDQLQ